MGTRVLHPGRRDGPDAVHELGSLRLANFRDARRGEQPEQHAALEIPLLIDDGFQELLDLFKAELALARDFRKLEVAEPARRVVLQPAQARRPSERHLELGREPVGAHLGDLALGRDQLQRDPAPGCSVLRFDFRNSTLLVRSGRSVMHDQFREPHSQRHALARLWAVLSDAPPVTSKTRPPFSPDAMP